MVQIQGCKNTHFTLSSLFKGVLFFALFSLFSFFSSFQEVSAAEVVSFYPTGSVKKVQQVTVRFSSDMIAMGDPRTKVDPFLITCNVSTQKQSTYKGEGAQQPVSSETPKYTTRWADHLHWVLEFESSLKSGLRCSFKINAEAKDLAGKKIDGLPEYSFSTAGPALLGLNPFGGSVEPDQYFVGLTDGSIDLKSIETTAYFEVEGVPDKVGVKIIEGKEYEEVVRAAIKSNWEWNSYRDLLEKDLAKKFSEVEALKPFIVLAAQRRFPEEARVVLHWPKGILSKTGLAVEEAQSFAFKVIKKFEAQFFCARAKPERPCNPLMNMNLQFTKPLFLKSLQGAQLVSPEGRVWIPEELSQKSSTKIGDETLSISSQKSKLSKKRGQQAKEMEEETVDQLTFKGPFPSSTKFKIVLPLNLKDELGRVLNNQNKYPLEVATDEYLPLLKFPASFGILELNGEPLLPVSVRNIEESLTTQQLFIEGNTLNLSGAGKYPEIIKWYREVKKKSTNEWESRNTPLLTKGQGTSLQIPKPLGEKEFELIGIPLKKPGFYVVEMESPRLGEELTGGGAMYVSTAVLVTDMAVHFKKGRESSLVWVTQLSSGKPVKGAQISILTGSGRELAHGSTNGEGLWHIQNINFSCQPERSSGGEEGSEGGSEEGTSDLENCEVFVFAQKGEDLSFVSSKWSQGIEAYRFNLPLEYNLNHQWGPMVLHTILDRMVAQPGDLIQMKHVIREHHEAGFTMMNEKHLPQRVLIVHQGSRKTYTLPFKFDKATGSATGNFSIPKDATLGRYSIYLSNSEKQPLKEREEESDPFDWSAQETGHFIVSQYRLPTMKATLKIQGEPLVQPKEVKVDLSASYLSGGAAKGLKVKLRAQLQSGYFRPNVEENLEYNFLSRPMKLGVIDSETHQSPEEAFLKVQELTLNPEGGLLASVKDLPLVSEVKQLALEMEYPDPSGEVKTVGSQVSILPGEKIIGLATESWFSEPGKTKVKGIIVDPLGKVQKDHPYTLEAFQTNSFTHRKRLVGGFYSYDSKTEIAALGKVCEGRSDDSGHFECEPKGLPAGYINLQAKTTDEKGRVTYASVGVDIFEKGAESWWVPSDSDRIDLLPEKKKYEPSEKAKIVVRTPYPLSTVLVTVEREGVLDSFVTELHRDRPVIEVPLKGNYAPNVFISALLVRGRVGDPQPTALLDLAKPVMKMGMAQLKVGWKAHELLVNLKASQTQYKAREKVPVTIQVKTAIGATLPEGTEVAIVVVDEALMRLKENTSWNLLKEMMGQRDLAVFTSSGQNQVVGRRHFGSKAKPPGGSGGFMAADNRELFEPVLLWQPHLKLNSSGEAQITVPLNDSVTSFRVVAIAQGGEALFGNGSVNIQSTKDLIIYSGFSPVAREGDQIQNAFTLRNTTTKLMKMSLEVSSKEIFLLPTLPPFELKPSESRTLFLPLKIPEGLKEISFRIKAKDSLSGSEDSMVSKMRVVPAVPVRVLGATLFQLDKSQQIPIKQPADSLPGRGGLGVHASTTLVSGLAGVKAYMSEYPYSCLEQKISKAISLEDSSEIKRIIEALPTYLDTEGLLKFFPVSYCGSPELTHYVMDILNENGFKIPQETVTRLLSGLTSYLNGRVSCHSWWDNFSNNQYSSEVKILVMETLSAYHAFDPSYLSTIQITLNLWRSETLINWFKLLKREDQIPTQKEYLKQAENILRARLNFQGSLMNLQEDKDLSGFAHWQLFTSPDQEAIGVFGLALEESSWASDVGRMARGLVARLRLGHWDTTLANSWGVTQMRRFSQKFEKEKVTGETKVSGGDVSELFKFSPSLQGDYKLLKWPSGSEGKALSLQFNHTGTGKPWIQFETLSAIPLKAPFNMGYKISRKLTPVLQESPGSWRVGDVVNIELTVVAQADQPWVVVRDPIPAGASHLGTGLSGTSNLLNQMPKVNAPSSEASWPSEYEEKSHTQLISYAAYLPRGTYKLNYRVRLNSAGEFKMPPSRVEAMYAPETFGEVPNEIWKISQ